MIVFNYPDSLEIYKTLQHINIHGTIGFGIPGLMAKARLLGWVPKDNSELRIVFNKTKSCYGILEHPEEEYDFNWVVVFGISTMAFVG